MTYRTIFSAALVAATMLHEGRVQAHPAAGPLLAESAAAAAPDSVRLQRAKDLISEDQWVAAITELRNAAADPKEPARDEALFWLAHSQNQAGDLAEAVQSIRRLQKEYPRSRWTAPGYSLLLELAQKLGRHDVLWRMAPPPPPAVPSADSALRTPRRRSRITPPVPPSAPAPPSGSVQPSGPPPPPLPPPPATWIAETYAPDTEIHIQALGRLIRTDAPKVIPLLGHIALESDNPSAARRAVFVLAQSRHPEAQSMVAVVARNGADSVRLAAVRELGRFGGPDVAQDLLEVYSTANIRIKQQVVLSLGDRAEVQPLLNIARSEADARLRDAAIVSLGRAGARNELRRLYTEASRAAREAVITGLVNARDDEGLIQIAREEKDQELRRTVLERLRLMGTPRARTFLATVR